MHLKRLSAVISNDPLFKETLARFTTVPFLSLIWVHKLSNYKSLISDKRLKVTRTLPLIEN